ncbi:MAG: hypothetical protein M1833_001169 [Piccolia ochrophora]|nr:MAG: hypothetical protein M1833_001169 [Piccolia ochrophora]
MTQMHIYNTVGDPDTVGTDPTPLPAYTAMDGSVTESQRTITHSPALSQQQSPAYMSAEQEKAQLAAIREQESVDSDSDHGRGIIQQPIMPSRDGPGHAPAALLSRGLQVPTSSRPVSSGFPYPDLLAQYQVTEEDWTTFTSEITRAARLKSSDVMLSIGGGAGTFLVSGLFIGWFAAIPAWFVGRHLYRRLTVKNLTQSRETGPLEASLLKWNQDYFSPRGLLIRLDLPGERFGLNDMDVQMARGCTGRWVSPESIKHLEGFLDERKKAKLAQKMEKWAAKAEKREGKCKRKAARKGRIVIMPLNRSTTQQDIPPASATVESEKTPAAYSGSIV